ncbi:MAG: J domain-containing protein [Chloroflexi bacterium]|nr:J domain-containing protein [Chloroflexota bacterium]
MSATERPRTETRDYYEVLGTEPSASTSELRSAFREAVLRHHPDRGHSSEVATRRTSILNRAWTELRDPVRRLHYDYDVEGGRQATLEWPLDEGDARHYSERGRTDDWMGALERMVALRPPFAEVVDARLREAYVASGEQLRGAMLFAGIAEAQPEGTAARRWAERELRALLGEYRDRHVRRGRAAQRAENAELLLNFLESIGIEPSFTDYRAAIVAHRRAGHSGRAAELVERVMAAPVSEPGRLFSLVQLLTEAGQLDRASLLLAAIARGDHPQTLDPRVVHNPWRRIAAARARLAAARRRGNGTG